MGHRIPGISWNLSEPAAEQSEMGTAWPLSDSGPATGEVCEPRHVARLAEVWLAPLRNGPVRKLSCRV